MHCLRRASQVRVSLRIESRTQTIKSKPSGAMKPTTVALVVAALVCGHQVYAPAADAARLAGSQEAPTGGAAPQANPQQVSLSAVRLRWRQLDSSLAAPFAASAEGLRQALDELYLADRKLEQLVSSRCKSALIELIEGVKQQSLWATRMLDASARHLPVGLLEGTLTELGNFDECLAIGHLLPQRQQLASPSGQYCTIQVKPPQVSRPRLHTVCKRLPALVAGPTAAAANQTALRFLSQQSHQFYYVGLRLGVCLPNKCSKQDVQHLLNSYLAKHELGGQVRSCQELDVQSVLRLQRQQALAADSPEAHLSLADYFGPLVFALSGFDLVQQCILLAFCALVLLSVVGTLADDEGRKQVAAAAALSARAKGAPADGVTRDSAAAAAAQDSRKFMQYQVNRSCSSCTETILTRNELAHTRLAAGDVGTQHNPLLLQSKRAATAAAPPTGADVDFCSINAERRPATSGSGGAFRALLVCFSLKANLRAIGQLSPASQRQLPPAHLQAHQRRRRQQGGKHLPPQARQLASAPPAHSHSTCEAAADVKVIHGLRTFAMFWIIFGHTIGLVGPEMMNSLFSLAYLSCSSRLLQALLNATLAVNTFFMISGLVTVISFGRKCRVALELVARRKQPLPPPLAASTNFRRSESLDEADDDAGEDDDSLLAAAARATSNCNQFDVRLASSIDCCSSVITSLSNSSTSNSSSAATSSSVAHSNPAGREDANFKPLVWLALRYLRLTPAYAATIGVSILLPALGSGPFWGETVVQLGPACRANWALNLLYVNNFVNTDKLCLIHSWYLSNDTQFFLVGLLLFATHYKSRKLCLVMFVTLLCASTATTFALTVSNEFPPTIVTTSPAIAERWQFIHTLYYKPWPHLPSYLVGLLFGYLVLIRDRVSLSGRWRKLCWALFALLSFALLNSVYPWNMGLQVDPLLAGLHSASFRTLWAVCSGWLVFALVTRPQNLLARFLSWRGFQLSGRLTYCAYLVHPLVIYYHFGSLRERMDSSVYSQLHRFVATLGLSYMLAFLLALLVESPSIQLQKLIVNKWLSGATAPEAATRDVSAPKTRDENLSRCGRRTAPLDENRIDFRLAAKQNGSTKTTKTTTAANKENNFSRWATVSSLTGDEGTSPNGGSLMTSVESFKQLLANEASLGGGSRAKSAAHCIPMTDCCAHSANNAARPDDELLDGRQAGSASTSSHSSAVDEEFQRKLAQAISRGFKIRSKFANGSNRPIAAAAAARRTGQAKGLPEAAAAGESCSPQGRKLFVDCKRSVAPTTGDGRPPKLATESSGADTATSSTNRLERQARRRGETCSTFVANENQSAHLHRNGLEKQ